MLGPPSERSKNTKTPSSISGFHSPDGSGNLVYDIQIYNDMYTKKLMEYDDRQEIKSFMRKTVKLFGLGVVLTCVMNRLLTKIKLERGFKLGRFNFKIDFMNFYFWFRIIIRGIVFGSSMYYVALRPMSDQIEILGDKMNKKYVPRYEKFMVTGNPLSMNMNMMKEPMTDEERESRKQFVDSMGAMNMQVPDKRI